VKPLTAANYDFILAGIWAYMHKYNYAIISDYLIRCGVELGRRDKSERRRSSIGV
jgi:hypothetical protein